MAGGRFGRATSRIGRGKDKRASLRHDFCKEWVVRDADTNSIVMVVIKVMKIWVFGENQGELTGNVFFNEWFGCFGDDTIFADFSFIFWY